MRLICPCCGAQASMEAWANDADCRQAMVAFAGMPRQTVAYIGFFRIQYGTRMLRCARVAKLSAELKAVMDTGHIQVGGKPARPAGKRVWIEALARMCELPPRRLPLKNHNYLRRVVYDLADVYDRKQDTRRNKSERDGTYRFKTNKAQDIIPLDKLAERIKEYRKK